MGGVLKAASIDQAAVEFVRAGGDLALICHQQENVERSFETLLRTAERDARFRRRVLESAKRVATFKRSALELKRRTAAPSPEKISRLSTQLWEFSEQVRIAALSAGATKVGATRAERRAHAGASE